MGRGLRPFDNSQINLSDLASSGCSILLFPIAVTVYRVFPDFNVSMHQSDATHAYLDSNNLPHHASTVTAR